MVAVTIGAEGGQQADASSSPPCCETDRVGAGGIQPLQIVDGHQQR
jgi:hypothetical protein